jgi:hypothetical protein
LRIEKLTAMQVQFSERCTLWCTAGAPITAKRLRQPVGRFSPNNNASVVSEKESKG